VPGGAVTHSLKETIMQINMEWYFDTDDDGTVTGGGYY
jgi:hypothetical protein